MMRNMDDHDHSSLVEALLSGFVNKKDNVDAQYEPTLIANHDGRTMEYAIKDELQRSQDFDMSVAFVSQGALQVLKQYFLDFADNNDHQAGRIITSTFNYFNSPKAFRELLKLQRMTMPQLPTLIIPKAMFSIMRKATSRCIPRMLAVRISPSTR